MIQVDVAERPHLHADGGEVDQAELESAGVVEGREQRVRDVHPLAIGTRIHHVRSGKARPRMKEKNNCVPVSARIPISASGRGLIAVAAIGRLPETMSAVCRSHGRSERACWNAGREPCRSPAG